MGDLQASFLLRKQLKGGMLHLVAISGEKESRHDLRRLRRSAMG